MMGRSRVDGVVGWVLVVSSMVIFLGYRGASHTPLLDQGFEVGGDGFRLGVVGEIHDQFFVGAEDKGGG